MFPDSVFEGKESFFISLQTVEESQTQVVLFPNSSNLTVNIVDPEDGEGWRWEDQREEEVTTSQLKPVS